MERGIPQWLMSMINAEFNTTQKQDENEKGYFCVNCGGNSISRKEKEEQHKGHMVLQAYNTSRTYGYKVKDVLKLGSNILDVSGIRPFSINNSHVYFPKSRSQKLSQLKNKGRPGYCFGCGYRVGDSYSFCSILCKVSYSVRENNFKTVAKIVKHEDLSQNLVNKKNSDEGSLVITNDIAKQQVPGQNLVNKKAEDKGNLVIIKNIAKQEDSRQNSVNNRGFRKRSRKGNPLRAPLF